MIQRYEIDLDIDSFKETLKRRWKKRDRGGKSRARAAALGFALQCPLMIFLVRGCMLPNGTFSRWSSVLWPFIRRLCGQMAQKVCYAWPLSA